MPLAEQTFRIYQEIHNNAETIVGNELFKVGQWATDKKIRIWRGYARELAERLSLSVPQVSSGLSLLDVLGSVSLIARSNQYRPALYVVLRPITIQEIVDLKERSLISGDLRTPTKNQRVNDSLNNAINRINKLETQVKILTLNLQNLSDKLREVGERYGNSGRPSTLPEVQADGNSKLSSDASGQEQDIQ